MQIVFSQCEDDGDGLKLSDQNESRGGVCRDKVAWIDKAETYAAVDWRSDVAEADLHLVILDGALIILHRALILQDDLLLIFERLARNGILGPRILIALEIHLRFSKQILIAIESALRLEELRLIGPRIDIDERIAFVTYWPSR